MKRTFKRTIKSGGNQRTDNRVNCVSRKAKRKAERQKKKQKMNLSYLQKFSKVKPSLEALEEITQKKDLVKVKKMPKKQAPPEKKSKPVKERWSKDRKDKKGVADSDSDFEMEGGKYDKRPVEDAVLARERKELAQLEKKLKMKKTSLPKSFLEDGLDFLLDVVDSTKLYSQEEKDLMVSQSTAKKDSAHTDSKSPKKKSKSGKRVHFQLDGDDSDSEEEGQVSVGDSEHEDSDQHSEGENSEDMGSDADEDEMEDGDEKDIDEEADEEDEDAMADEEDEGDEGSDNEDERMGSDDDDGDEEEEEEEDVVKEDIYGRLVDSQGNLISKKEQGGAYIPPAKRAAMLAKSGQESVELDRLKKQLKGLLNRASEANLQSIANSVESMYMQHSRAAINQSLLSLIYEAVVSPVVAPERLAAELVMLVSVLHGNVGSEVGAYFLQGVVKKYEELRHCDGYGEGHTMDNVLLLLCFLYNFKVAHHSLLFEVMSQLVESFSEKDIELLLLVLRTSGFYLRRDDPEALGEQITGIQQKAQGMGGGNGPGAPGGGQEQGGVPFRARFMLEVLVAVRNNNVRRVPGADLQRSDRLRQLAGKFVRGASLGDSQLNIGLKDLLQAEDKGRWWIVGSAWEGRMEPSKAESSGPAKSDVATSVGGAVSQRLVALAKKLRINSDVRRSIFYVIMSSEDYEDAFQKVLGLGLRGQQQQEIVVVTALCCKHQASYNPFFSFLLQKLATHDRKFMIAVQFHMWDMFKTMDDLSSNARNNLAAMLAHLLASKALSLSVLKVLEFGILSQSLVRFLRHVMTVLLDTTSLTDLRDIFRTVAQLVKFRALTVGLRMFLVKHLVKLEGDSKKKLVEVCDELSRNHQMLM